MEALRWILLGVGIFFVFLIYLLGRSRRPQVFGSSEPESEELPEFSANNWKDDDDDIADVHITARELDDVHLDDEDSVDIKNELPDGEQVFEKLDLPDDGEKNKTQDIIVLTVIARSEEGLHGDRINSAAIANNLKYGSMEIFHRMGGDAKPVFSVANMVEPGNFNPDTIHELRTPGLTFFMQLPVYDGTLNALADMLQCAYQISELLEADLCDKNRELLTESGAESLRELAKQYDSE